MKHIRVLTFLLAFSLVLAGCGKAENSDDPIMDYQEPIPFSRGGVIFDLPEEFTDYSHSPLAANYVFLYASPYVGIYGLRDPSGGLDPEITSLETFVDSLAQRYTAEAIQKDGIWVMSYENLEQNEPQTIVCAFYEVGDVYWSICSYCPSDLFEENSDAMWRYVTSVKFE